jgi:hypothetical protein
MKKIAVIMIAIVLTACGDNGSEYVGKWARKDNPKLTAEIARNGDSFIIKQTDYAIFTPGLKTTNIPATFKDGLLQVQTGMGSANISYVKDRDTLLWPTIGGSTEYQRSK